MKTYKYILPILCAGAVMGSCSDLFEPAIEMVNDVEVMYKDQNFASGLLGNAYILVPYGDPESDLATDDAVSNQTGNRYTLMANGGWSSTNDPVSQWQARNNAIQYLNLFLANVEQVSWSLTPALNQMFIDQNKGDALAMRALQRFYLLRSHAGKVNGELMGVPFFDDYQTATSDFNLSRLTFQECYNKIMEDLDAAEKLLPENYGNIASESDVPAKYKEIGGTKSYYERAFGPHFQGRLCGQLIKALKAQIKLFCASPAYGIVSWQEAAQAAVAVIGRDHKVVADGHLWYADSKGIDILPNEEDPAEMLWRGRTGASNGLETNNYPPSIDGNGRINPTQNLVDAFPMANGLPIDDPKSGYDPQNPYAGRDPRLDAYIVVNGSTMGPKNTVIYTGKYDDSNKEKQSDDNIGKQADKSTVTGYYMRKLLRNDLNLSNSGTQKHYQARIRWTEIFLIFAEAANEAYGPDAPVEGTSYTAKTVIKAIRERAGICVGTQDEYLNRCAANKDDMRKLIRNERRLELCFENHRFYDLRRWQEDLNAPIKIMTNTNDANYTVSGISDNYARKYESYMNYGPIPDSEIKKYGNLVQNDGWK